MKGLLSRVLRYSFLIILGISQFLCADNNQSQSTSHVQQLSAQSVTRQPEVMSGKTLSEREALNELLALVAKAPRPDGDTQGWPIALPNDCGCDEAVIKALLIEIRDRIGLPSCDCDSVFNCLCAIKALVEAGGASNIDVIASTVDVIESYVEAINSKIDTLDITAILQVQSTLDECCTTMNSKMDIVIDDVDAINSKIDTLDITAILQVQSTLDQCCTTMNSKMDLLLDDAFTIESKIDLLDFSALVKVQSTLDECCATMNSKMDVLDAEVGIINGTVNIIDDKVDMLGTSIGDVLVDTEAIESKIDSCCFTSNSKLDVIDTEVGVINGTVNIIDDKVDLLGTSIGDVLLESSVVESLIDSCCYTSNVKLDALLVDSLVIANKIDVVDDKVDMLGSSIGDVLVDTSIIESLIDSCCYTSNVKLDALLVDSLVIANKIDVVDDKVDMLGTSIGDVLAETSVIESLIDDCCFTSNSKLDVVIDSLASIQADVSSIDNELQHISGSHIDQFVSSFEVLISMSDDLLITLSSISEIAIQVEESLSNLEEILSEVSAVDAHIGTLSSTLDECCFTVNSKLDVIDTEVGVINGTVNIIDDKVDFLGTSIGDVLAETSIIESLIDNCCYTTNSKLDVIIEQGESILEGLNVVVDVQAIESIVDNISSVLDECCYTSNSKLDILLDDSFTIESKIDLILVGAACEPTPITSADSVNNIVTLANSGNYCLSSDLTATVVITANNVTLCLNNRQLTGLIDISGSQALIKNGVVLATGDDSSQPVIRINAGATSTIISNVSATAQNATAGAGRDALAITANNVFVEKGILQSGSAVTGAGGHGIHCISPCQKAVIRFVDIIGTGSGTGDDGGDGIRIDSGCSSIEIRGCTISNTGESSTGNAGIAINDQHAALPVNYSSVILNNMAYDIANTSTVYEIRNLGAPGPSQGVSITVGAPGLYDNVYLP